MSANKFENGQPTEAEEPFSPAQQVVHDLFARRMDPSDLSLDAAVITFADSKTTCVYLVSPSIRAVDLHIPRGRLTSEQVAAEVTRSVSVYEKGAKGRGWVYRRHDVQFADRHAFYKAAQQGLHSKPDVNGSFEEHNTAWIERTLVDVLLYPHVQ